MMVEPTKFFFNTETACDNEFMHDVEEDNEAIANKAIQEHRDLRAKIEEAGITVTKYEQMTDDLPDSLFPNNWFSTHKYPGNIDNRLVCVYPMKAPTRQREVNLKIIEDFSDPESHTIDLTGFCEKGQVLEGTGALIFDPVNLKVYANISQRCEKDVLDHFLEQFNSKCQEPFRSVVFSSCTSSGTPIYHTNVMFSVLSEHIVVCLESIPDEEERKKVVEEITSSELNKYPKKLLEISLDEVNNMCGNIICVLNKDQEPCVIMATTAYNGFKPENLEELKAHYKIIHSDVSTIEKIGGGSAR